MFDKISELSDSKKGLYFVLLISLLTKILVLIIMHDMAINRDGTQYIAAAQQFAQGNFRQGFAFHSMPFYPLIIAIVNFVIRNWLLSARLISIGSLVLSIIPLYLITKDLFNRKAAFWCCIAFFVAPEVNQLAMEVFRDSVYLFCLLWSVYFAQRAIQKKELLFFFLAAFFSWMPILFRIEGVILVPFYIMFLGFLFCIFIFNAQERVPYLKGLVIWVVYFCLIVAVFLIVIGPQFISFNKLDKVATEIHKISGFRVGESYRKIYAQLKMLEDMSSYASGNQNFAEVARHYMPLIYLFGFIEVIVKNIFIFFLIPLIWGLRSSFSRAHIFLIAFVGFYLLAIFYTYVERDFIQSRFLQAPAILLFPWIGLGLQKIFSKVKESPRPKLLLAICAIFFICLPMGKYARALANEEVALFRAGEWIKKDSRFQSVTFYTNDSRIGFHAGKKRREYEKVDSEYDKKKRKNGLTLEQFAIENKIDIIALKISKKKIKSAPQFVTYRKIKEFKGKKRNVLIYCSPAFCKKSGI